MYDDEIDVFVDYIIFIMCFVNSKKKWMDFIREAMRTCGVDKEMVRDRVK